MISKRVILLFLILLVILMGCGQKVKCGDGICHRSEYRQNSCSADCKEISVIINDSKPPILSPPDEPIVYDNNSPIASVCGDGLDPRHGR